MMNLFKKLKVAFLLIVILTISCKKVQDMDQSQNIIGRWEWLSTYKLYILSDSNPLTPQNTGNHEILIFNLNHSWYKTLNGIKTDSGTFSTGHGTKTPYSGAKPYVYDSICYYQNDVQAIGIDYFKVFNDTLEFAPGFAGKYISYSLPYNSSKFLIKR
jgi:hypothetical protein